MEDKTINYRVTPDESDCSRHQEEINNQKQDRTEPEVYSQTDIVASTHSKVLPEELESVRNPFAMDDQTEPTVTSDEVIPTEHSEKTSENNFREKIEASEKDYENLLMEAMNLKQGIITQLDSEKNDLMKRTTKKNIAKEFLTQDLKNTEKKEGLIAIQDDEIDKTLEEKNRELKEVQAKIKQREEKVSSLSQQLTEVSEFLTKNEQRIKNADSYSEASAQLIALISKAKADKEQLEASLEIEELKLELQRQRYLAIEQIHTAEQTQFLKEKEKLNQTKDKIINEIVSYKEQAAQINDDLFGLLKDKQFVDKKLYKFKGTAHSIITRTLKKEGYFLIAQDLPQELNEEEAASMNLWNPVIAEAKQFGILTLGFNPKVGKIFEAYQAKGLIEANCDHHNLYLDLLQLESVDEETFKTWKEKYSGDVLTELVDNQGHTIMKVVLGEKNEMTQQFYNLSGEAVLKYDYRQQKLEKITYKDEIFSNELELISYWLFNFVESNTLLNVIVEQQSPLLMNREMMERNGISILPVISSYEESDGIFDMIKEGYFDELFVLNNATFKAFSETIKTDTVIHILEDMHADETELTLS